MAENEDGAQHDNYVKQYVENVMTSTKVLVDGDKANAFKFMTDAVENTKELVDRIVHEIEVAEGEIWSVVDAPATGAQEDMSLAKLEELQAELVTLTGKVEKLAASRRG